MHKVPAFEQLQYLNWPPAESQKRCIFVPIKEELVLSCYLQLNSREGRLWKLTMYHLPVCTRNENEVISPGVSMDDTTIPFEIVVDAGSGRDRFPGADLVWLDVNDLSNLNFWSIENPPEFLSNVFLNDETVDETSGTSVGSGYEWYDSACCLILGFLLFLRTDFRRHCNISECRFKCLWQLSNLPIQPVCYCCEQRVAGRRNCIQQ